MNQRAALVAACLVAIVSVTLSACSSPPGTRPGSSSAARSSPQNRLAPSQAPPTTSLAPHAKPESAAPLGHLPKPSSGPGRNPTASPTPTVTPTGTPPTAPPSGEAPGLPIRAVFFYPWYPESWYPTIHYTPTLGARYDSSSPSVLAYQVAAMEYAHIDVAIASWWGPGTPTDGRVPLLLNASAGTSLRWALYYEPVPGTQAADLNYIFANYGSSPYYEHLDGKPVLFVYSRSVASCADAANWVAVNAGRFYLDLQVFGGYQSCASQPDQWHQYGPASRTDELSGHSYSISPGYWKYDSATPLLARDPAAFATAVQDMVASAEPWQLITTWNEWGEGTAVEDAVQWASKDQYGQYVDILHADP